VAHRHRLPGKSGAALHPSRPGPDRGRSAAVDFDWVSVKEHATLAAGANVDHGVDVKTTENHVNRAADRGCVSRLVRILVLIFMKFGGSKLFPDQDYRVRINDQKRGVTSH